MQPAFVDDSVTPFFESGLDLSDGPVINSGGFVKHAQGKAQCVAEPILDVVQWNEPVVIGH